MLEIVQAEKQASRFERLHEPLPAHRSADAEFLRDHCGDKRCIADGRQADERRLSVEARDNLDRNPGLARTASARERDEALCFEKASELRHLL